MINKLTDFEKEDLENIIKEMGHSEEIFSNECQFQFKLAWKLREVLGEKIQIELEYLDDDNPNGKKYIDIWLEDEDGVIPIELKYKTPQTKVKYERQNKKTVYTFAQGASDEGSYDYLRDIQRIESISKSNDNFIKGFAVMLTNESLYWGEGKKSVEESPWRNFFLYKMDDKSFLPDKDKEKFEKGGNLGWYIKGDGDNIKDENHKERNNVIRIKTYELEWKDYCNTVKCITPRNTKKNYMFKYLLCEINKEEK